MRQQKVLGIRTVEGAKILQANDVTLRGTYWFDLRARTPAGASLKRAFDVAAAVAVLAISAPILMVLLPARGVIVERRVGFRGHEFDAYALRGRFLRALPRLFNVLEGSMSLVGPRALAPDEVTHSHARRFSMRPGMTGLWRVRGGSEADADRAYVNEWSLWLDLTILARTLLRR